MLDSNPELRLCGREEAEETQAEEEQRAEHGVLDEIDRTEIFRKVVSHLVTVIPSSKRIAIIAPHNAGILIPPGMAPCV